MQASSACALLRIDLSQIPLCSNYRHGKFTQPENVTLQGFVGGAAQRCKAEFLWHAVHREEPVWGTRTYRRLIRCASIASVPWIHTSFICYLRAGCVRKRFQSPSFCWLVERCSPGNQCPRYSCVRGIWKVRGPSRQRDALGYMGHSTTLGF